MRQRRLVLALAAGISLPALCLAGTPSEAAQLTAIARGHDPQTATPAQMTARRSNGLQLAMIAMSRDVTPKQAKSSAREALKLLAPFVAKGDAEVTWSVGYLYATGTGVPLNWAKGIRLIETGANDGNRAAAHWLSVKLRDAHPTTAAERKQNRLARHYLAIYQGPVSHRDKVVAPSGDVKMAKAALHGASGGVVAALGAEPIKMTPPISLQPMRLSTPKAVMKAVAFREHAPARPIAGGAVLPRSHVSTATVKHYLSVPVVPASNVHEIQALKKKLAVAKASIKRLRHHLAKLEASLTGFKHKATLPALLNKKGVAAVKEGNYVSAIPLFRKSADKGFAPAQANLGAMYLNGTGVPCDTRQAIDLFKQAAAGGDKVAARNLGMIYEYGLGIPREPSLAIGAFEQAAMLGDHRAYSHLRQLGAKNIQQAIRALERTKS